MMYVVMPGASPRTAVVFTPEVGGNHAASQQSLRLTGHEAGHTHFLSESALMA
jgi:hypothetical protein